ncbi:glutamyl-tRNA synthetase [Alcanivorax hongdengensis A-11-3]|uniref:Glutamyl-tRNA synthetase n=1 Tax=Alcanivorax hongdengensis A-11-3 TaxID=1177179 RepID=L0WHM5_9GAMM|nr:tRNA glutamyl-Q(34) synthetase GluQRS [Alcanivorax hongdengensis]EKF75340.1 glutamyl-tRNA synthetase [Alcanivorax hongdengensis A-11-3]
MSYRGRFAPTPSGPLHFGSLVAALASWLEARSRQGQWFVRIDDLDPPREVPGAADTILAQLDTFQLHWDGPVRYQSQRGDAYQDAVETLLTSGHAFYCAMTRQQLAALDHQHPGAAVAVPAAAGTAVRVTVPDQQLCFDDGIQGRTCANLQREGGAFVIRRRDGLFGYQLACALDDADDGITDVLRGADLLDSTLRQRWLLACLQRPAPRYAHLPVVTDGRALKLSKSRGSDSVSERPPGQLMQAALQCMGLTVSDELHGAPPARLLQWALEHYPQHRWPTGTEQPLPALLQS